MMLAWLIVVVASVFVVARLVTHRLPSAPSPDQDRLLAEQAERIEQLEDELQRVKEQADFTERLLTERGESRSEDAPSEQDRTE